MEETMENLSLFGDIGNVLGYPAMLLIFWLYTKVKDIQKRLDDGDSVMKKLDEKVNSIGNDVSFIRGMLEGTKEEQK